MADVDWDVLINDLKKEERFLWRWSRINGAVWIILSTFVVILTSATSVLVAMGKTGQDPERTVAAILPALAAIFATIIAQFHLRDSWQVHELSRIDVKDLKGQAELARSTSPQDADKWKEIHMKLYEIRRRQATSYFAFLSERKDDNRGSQGKPA